MVELSVKCKGCGQRKTFSAQDEKLLRKTFSAQDEKLLRKMIAESLWAITPSRTECPRCFSEVMRSYEAVASGRSW